LSVANKEFASARAVDRPYGRYVRFDIDISGITLWIDYSLYMETYAAS
jgi:hypothetical protein